MQVTVGASVNCVIGYRIAGHGNLNVYWRDLNYYTRFENKCFNPNNPRGTTKVNAWRSSHYVDYICVQTRTNSKNDYPDILEGTGEKQKFKWFRYRLKKSRNASNMLETIIVRPLKVAGTTSTPGARAPPSRLPYLHHCFIKIQNFTVSRLW